MVNRGVAPADSSTDVGRFRYLYGDITYTDLDPVEAGYGDYSELSDSEIEVFLSVSDDSVSRAIGYYYLQLAGQAAKVAESVKDYDLQIDESKKSEAFRKAAMDWFDRADTDDLNSEEAFVIAAPYSCEVIPEATIPQYGRYYTTGRIW